MQEEEGWDRDGCGTTAAERTAPKTKAEETELQGKKARQQGAGGDEAGCRRRGSRVQEAMKQGAGGDEAGCRRR
ncbi:MAG: hypothetical protein IJ754_04120 [Bacteroidaceae bacterium]|nr:hypothetical protein [Bacteroidaceae bacterium]